MVLGTEVELGHFGVLPGHRAVAADELFIPIDQGVVHVHQPQPKRKLTQKETYIGTPKLACPYRTPGTFQPARKARYVSKQIVLGAMLR